MAGKIFAIDTRTFQKKGDARNFFKSMLNRYRVGDVVTGTDDADLRALLKRHTEYRKKLGSGIDRFEVMANLYDDFLFGFWYLNLCYKRPILKC